MLVNLADTLGIEFLVFLSTPFFCEADNANDNRVQMALQEHVSSPLESRWRRCRLDSEHQTDYSSSTVRADGAAFHMQTTQTIHSSILAMQTNPKAIQKPQLC